jgi:hypothetical protein
MRRIIFTILISALLGVSIAEASCACYTDLFVWNNGVQTHYFSGGGTLYLTCDSAHFHARTTSSQCQSWDVSLSFNGNLLDQSTSYPSTYNFQVSNSGYYHLDHWCSLTHFLLDAQITISTIGVEEEESNFPFHITPSLSSGIFKINSANKNLKQLFITDNTGRIILSSNINFSEINLTNFSPGIYFYAITDEKENIFRGRIVKE